MATGRDVAALAGTSTAVVSYVFNDGPRNVAPETRARVLAAAERLSYRPNALARALSHGRTASFGLSVPDVSNPYFGELARDIEQSANDHERVLLIGDAGLDPERERRIFDVFVERRVDAAIIASVQNEPDLGMFHRAGIPVVALHPVEDAKASSLTIDYAAAATVGTAHLVQHGYAPIGLLNGPVAGNGAAQHRRGHARALPEGAAVDERSSAVSRQDAAVVAEEWLAGPDRPRAIFAATDEQALGVLFAAHRRGLRVPEDLAVVGVDGTQHSAFSIPPLTTVRQPLRELARRAVDFLAGPPGDEPLRALLDFELVARASCGCLEARADR